MRAGNIIMSAPRIAFPFFRKLYYRSLYGQNNFLEKQFSGLIQYGDRRWGKGDSPRAKEVWEAQYQNGMWDSLNGLGQVGRYSMIAGYLQHFKQGGILLDVGCGEGILQENLRSSSYSRYVGVDISGDAIKRASQRKDDRTSFVEADAISYNMIRRLTDGTRVRIRVASTPAIRARSTCSWTIRRATWQAST